MTEIDLTVAVAAHSETVVAGPTMASVEKAIGRAKAAGFHVEKLISLDSPTQDSRAFFEQPSFREWKTIILQMRDLGLVRNEIARIARGLWISWLDSDDLFS